MAETTPNESKPRQTKQKVTIDVPKDLNAIYGNVAFISSTPAEIILDFAQVLPRMPRGKVLSRVIMSPMHAKLLLRALTQNLANHERQYGEIRMPTNLADQFFRFPQGEEDDDSDDE